MKDNYYITRKILARINSGAVNTPVSASDFLDIGTRMAVDQAFSRLVRRGQLLRVGRGLYAIPRVSEFTGSAVTQSPDSIAKALGRKLKCRVLPSGGLAANLLGLSKQVPAKMIYLTDGRARTIRVGGQTLYFRHMSPRTMAVTGRMAPLVFQALRYVGRKRVSSEEIIHLNHLLKKKDKKELLDNLSNAPQWMRPLLVQIAGPNLPRENNVQNSDNFN